MNKQDDTAKVLALLGMAPILLSSTSIVLQPNDTFDVLWLAAHEVCIFDVHGHDLPSLRLTGCQTAGTNRSND